MQKTWVKNYVIIGIIAVLIAIVILLVVSVQSVRAQQITNTTAQERKEAATAKREAVQARLTDVRLKVCQNREKRIDSLVNRINERGTKQLEVFTRIADRTQAFYVDAGETLDTYGALVDDVNAKKVAAEQAVTSTDVTFDCEGENPKGVIEELKAARLAQNEALKAYKTSVKNLIVGVKSVQATTETSEGDAQ